MSAVASGARSRAPMGLLAAAFVVLVWPVILGGGTGPSEATDQAKAHEPLIRTLAEQGARIDWTDVEVATAPGYHVALAAVARLVSDDRVVLQLASSLFSLGLLLVVWRTAARRAGPGRAALLCLPLLASSYFLGGAIWLTTDNAALLFVALAVGGASFAEPTPGRITRWGLYAAAAVAVRQVHLEAAVPGVLAALGAGPARRLAPAVLRRTPGLGAGASLATAPAVLAPFAVVALLVARWGGLVPPAYAHLHDAGADLANVSVALALAGIFGIFFLPVAGVAPGALLRPRRGALLALGVGLAIGLGVPSSYDPDAGRWGGPLWEAVRRLGAVGDRSVLLAPLAVLGALVMRALVRAAGARRRETVLLLAALIAWVIAQSLNSQAWQRYSEPMILIALAWLAALASPARGASRRLAGIGPALLAAVLFAVSAWTLYLPVLRAWQGRALPG